MIGWPRRIPRVEAQRPRWLFTADVETTGRRGVFIQAAHLSAAQIVHDGPQIGFLGAARSTRQRCCSPSTTLTTTSSGSPRKLISPPPHPIGGSVNRQRVSGNPDRIAGPGRGADAPGSTGHRHVAAAADTRPPRSPRRPTTAGPGGRSGTAPHSGAGRAAPDATGTTPPPRHPTPGRNRSPGTDRPRAPARNAVLAAPPATAGIELARSGPGRTMYGPAINGFEVGRFAGGRRLCRHLPRILVADHASSGCTSSGSSLSLSEYEV